MKAKGKRHISMLKQFLQTLGSEYKSTGQSSDIITMAAATIKLIVAAAIFSNAIFLLLN